MLPAGATATLRPDATGVGHVFWYTVDSPTRSLRELRALQDWFIRYQLNAVPGVAEVASVGGMVQQYQIDVDRISRQSRNAVDDDDVNLALVRAAESQQRLKLTSSRRLC
jgi:Cu(I)/Ag(I) efflux system membrane protein CusA/SilA